MRYIILISFFLIYSSVLLSQVDSIRIELPIKNAQDFEFIHNNHGKACLFLNQGDAYCIMLLDSNYQVLAEFKDKYYTVRTPQYVGSIATENRFELFFKRVEDDELLVLIIDSDLKKLTRIKEFKISDNPNEKIIYSGSTMDGNKMFTISHDQNSIIYKKHLPGLKIENSFIQLAEEDYIIVKNEYCISIKSNADSLILLYKIVHKGEKNPYYKVFNMDFNNGDYNAVDIVCDHKRQQQYLHARLYENTLILGNCGSDFKLFDRLNGNLIKEYSINLDSAVNNEKFNILKYSYTCPFIHYLDTRQYTYLEVENRKGLSNFNYNFDFIEDSSGTYLKMKYSSYYNYGHCHYSICIYLPFDWEKKTFKSITPIQQPKINDYVVHEIDKRTTLNINLTGYFFGFKDELLFGYLTRKSKEFIIERPDY